MGNTKIEQQFVAKFLGVIISSDLGWSKHIDVVRSKSTKNVGIIAKVRHIFPETQTRVLYLALVCRTWHTVILFGLRPGKQVNWTICLEFKKKYCRLITFSHFQAHSKPLFQRLYILNVYNIYKFQLAIFMFKIINNLIPQSASLFLRLLALFTSISLNSIQYRHLHAPTYKLSRWRARRTKITRWVWARWGYQEKKWVFNLVLKLFNERSGSRRCTGSAFQAADEAK